MVYNETELCIGMFYLLAREVTAFPSRLLGVLTFAVSTGFFKNKRSNYTAENSVSSIVGQT